MSWTPPSPSYPARVVYVHDGDTVGMVIAVCPILGLYLGTIEHPHLVRFKDCNARELSEPGGTEATSNLARILDPGTDVILHNVRQDPHGQPPRWDADIECERFSDLATYLIDQQWLAAYPGHGPKVNPPWPRTIE